MQQLMDSDYIVAPVGGSDGKVWQILRKQLAQQGKETVTKWVPDHEASYPTRERAVEWIVTHYANQLGPGKSQLFDELLRRAGGAAADVYQMLFIVLALRRGWSRAQLLKYAAPPPPPRLRQAS